MFVSYRSLQNQQYPWIASCMPQVTPFLRGPFCVDDEVSMPSYLPSSPLSGDWLSTTAPSARRQRLRTHSRNEQHHSLTHTSAFPSIPSAHRYCPSMFSTERARHPSIHPSIHHRAHKKGWPASQPAGRSVGRSEPLHSQLSSVNRVHCILRHRRKTDTRRAEREREREREGRRRTDGQNRHRPSVRSDEGEGFVREEVAHDQPEDAHLRQPAVVDLLVLIFTQLGRVALSEPPAGLDVARLSVLIGELSAEDHGLEEGLEGQDLRDARCRHLARDDGVNAGRHVGELEVQRAGQQPGELVVEGNDWQREERHQTDREGERGRDCVAFDLCVPGCSL